MAAANDLRRTQLWMQRFIVDPDGDASVHRRNRRTAERLVSPSSTLSPVERVAIYRDMYLLRMEEALASDFPALKHHLGDAAFMRLVAGYVEAHPSRSYTLGRLRSRLPGYVRARARVRAKGFVFDLARVELATCEVFDEEESPVLSPEEAAGAAAGLGERTRIRTIRALRLLALRYPANEYLQAFKDGRRSPALRPRPAWLAVYRRDGVVWRMSLERPAFRILGAIQGGLPLGRALRAGGGVGKGGEERIFHSFRRWASAGLISAIE